MGGTKEVTFEKPFLYSEGGTFEESNSITVREPGLDLFHIHGRMQSITMKSVFKFANSERQKIQEEEETTGEAVDPSKRSVDALAIVAAAYDEEDYAKTIAWMKKTLTNQPKLAFVTGTKVPVTDEVWESLEAEGGVDAVMSVLSEFAGFFFRRLEPSKSASGGSASGGSASPTKDR
jgi:hypothetical protein